ncbi:MAG TPA: glycosyltransferase family 2 protein [Pyrinomonadaceae bacterium]|nr:glycosyltransferase family 2 protein [Pyrinomonadaceae bacterium]
MRAKIGDREFAIPLEISRPDVIDYFGRSAESDRCGFSIEVRMPRGRRLLTLEAQIAGSPWRVLLATTVQGPLFGRRGERRRRQERDFAATSQRYRWWYDRPADWDASTRILYVSGWFIDIMGLPVHGIRARIGRQFFPANINLSREDLLVTYPDLPLARRGGFAVAIPLPRGTSKLVLQYQGPDSVWRDFDFHRVRYGNHQAELPPLDQLPFFTAASACEPRFFSWVHIPEKGEIRERRLRLAGWCFAREGPAVEAVRARAGHRVSCGEFGIVRRDVAFAHNNRAGSLHSGFLIHASIPRGRHRLVLEARDGSGRWEPFLETIVRRSIFGGGGPSLGNAAEIYAHWISRYERITRREKHVIKRQINAMPRRPRFSILLPVYESDPRWLRRALLSVRQQFYPDWELCVVDDASTKSAGWKIVERYARADGRIKMLRRETRGGIAATSNDALSFATGEFVALLDHDDTIAPEALYLAAAELERNPALQLIYTDEDKIDEYEQRHSPYFKPEWNPDLFLAQNYVSHLTLLRTDLVRRVAGFRSAFDGSQDYDLLLRCIAQIKPDRIARIARVLYHWRTLPQSTAASTSAKNYAHTAAVRAVQEYLDTRKIKAKVEPREFEIYQRVHYPLPETHPLVSIIIPSRDQSALLEKCVDSVLHKSDYTNFEIVILENNSVEEQTHQLYSRLQKDRRIQIVESAGEFNFSRLINLGASHARGPIFLLLNNDVEIMNPDCLRELVSQVSRPEIGIVGARLWYPNGTLQHGGVILGVGGVASHIDGIRRHEPGYFARQHLAQDFCAVTAACLMVRREVFEKLGGFDELHLPVTFNDVDFCLRARELGWRIIYSPYAELIHHESISRGIENTTEKQRRFFKESEFLLSRWGALIQNDPAYNPNLSLGEKRFELAFPPRVTPPWKKSKLARDTP